MKVISWSCYYVAHALEGIAQVFADWSFNTRPSRND
jgi:hypothetical protein